MRFSQYLVVSCGSRHLVATHLGMNASGRCELLDYYIADVNFDSSDPLLWLKAASQQFADIRRRFPADLPTGYMLPGHLALSKYLKIPQVPIKKRSKIVAYEAKQNVPYPINEVTWADCLIDEDDLDFESVIVAAKTDLVEALSLYGKDAKMDPDRIEPSFMGLINSYRFNYGESADDAAIIVSIGAKSTDFVFLGHGKFFSRNVSLGGNTVTQQLGDELGIPYEDAERIKLDAIGGRSIPSDERASLANIADQFNGRLTTELSRTLAIARRQGWDAPIRLGLLTGGGACLPGLLERIGGHMSVPFERLDPLKRVRAASISNQDSLEADKPFIAGAIGMAIACFLPDSPSADLLPRSIVWQRKFRKQQPYYLFAGLVACATVMLPVFNASIEIRAYEQEIRNLDAQTAPLRERNAQIGEKLKTLVSLKETIEKAAELSRDRSNWMVFLNDMQDRLMSVEDVWLDTLEVMRPERPKEATAKGRLSRSRKSAKSLEPAVVKLRLEGRLLDAKNPMSTVSQDSFNRVKALVESFERSSFIIALENERYDNTVPGILRFDFTLLVDETQPL